MSKHVLKMFGGDFFEKIFFAQCTQEGRNLEKIQNKSKNFQNFKNVQKRSQKCPDLFSTCLEVTFFENCQLGWLVAKKLSFAFVIG